MYKQLREQFIDFFVKQHHSHLPSSSLIPHNDPSLLFVNSGMVQFKDIFTGVDQSAHSRVVTVQKCLRAGGKHNDLDNVGYTSRHHTFFEMLGNFSFQDYFKADAIEFAWDFLTKELSLSKDKLYITVYHTDNEAWDIWHRLTGFSESKILRIDTSDNFWSMGDTGPCGPCSEIYYDYGRDPDVDVAKLITDGSDQCVEIWNLVFMQMYQDSNGLKPLSRPSIDTGMGLERMVAVLEGVQDNYATSLFQGLIRGIRDIYSVADADMTACRVAADHIRAMAFLISDGVLPSNEGRGYVLRRIMRRAMRYLHQLNATDAKMHELVALLETQMGGAYTEISKSSTLIANTIRQEESGFKDTLDRGLNLLHAEVDRLGSGKIFSGEMAFKLYDTYGFPVDLTADVLCRMGLTLDIDGFEKFMASQRERAKAAGHCSSNSAQEQVWFNIKRQIDAREQFRGYDNHKLESKIAFLVDESGNLVDHLSQGVEGWMVTEVTPFYSEGGGQVGDTGTITTSDTIAKVLDTQKFASTVIAHRVMIVQGVMQLGNMVLLSIDVERRNACARHHSATHILHHVLRSVLGNHLLQKGSRVNEEDLHFDFNHHQALDRAQITEIERKVNEMIVRNLPVGIRAMDKKMADTENALGIFGEKYGDIVRVVDIGSSKELCGGTHVSMTGEIGLMRIVAERSIGSGIRRITAVAGLALLEQMYNTEKKHLDLVDSLQQKHRTHDVAMEKKLDILSRMSLALSLQASHGDLHYFYAEDFSVAVGRKFYKEMLPHMRDKIAVFISKNCSSDKYSWIVASGPNAKCQAVDLARRITECTGDHMPSGGYSSDCVTFGSKRLLQHAEVLPLLTR